MAKTIAVRKSFIEKHFKCIEVCLALVLQPWPFSQDSETRPGGESFSEYSTLRTGTTLFIILSHTCWGRPDWTDLSWRNWPQLSVHLPGSLVWPLPFQLESFRLQTWIWHGI